MKYEIDFDWLFYLAKVHLNYNKEEFWESTHAEIYKMWKFHVKFNGWDVKNDNEIKDNGIKYTRMNIDEIDFL